MNRVNADSGKELLLLANEKLDCLYRLKNSLSWLCQNIETSELEEILKQIDFQNNCLEKLINIDKQYAALYNDDSNPIDNILLAKLAEQKQIMSELKILNQTATEKAQQISSFAKEKLIKINQQRNTLSCYKPEKGHQLGVFLDYKK